MIDHVKDCVCEDCRKADIEVLDITPREIEDVLNVLADLVFQVETQYIDWARFNPDSPDYVQGYKPEYPPCVKRAHVVRAWLEKRKL